LAGLITSGKPVAATASSSSLSVRTWQPSGTGTAAARSMALVVSLLHAMSTAMEPVRLLMLAWMRRCPAP
jgi:hypothetical protein